MLTFFRIAACRNLFWVDAACIKRRKSKLFSTGQIVSSDKFLGTLIRCGKPILWRIRIKCRTWTIWIKIVYFTSRHNVIDVYIVLGYANFHCICFFSLCFCIVNIYQHVHLSTVNKQYFQIQQNLIFSSDSSQHSAYINNFIGITDTTNLKSRTVQINTSVGYWFVKIIIYMIVLCHINCSIWKW